MEAIESAVKQTVHKMSQYIHMLLDIPFSDLFSYRHKYIAYHFVSQSGEKLSDIILCRKVEKNCLISFCVAKWRKIVLYHFVSQSGEKLSYIQSSQTVEN